MYGNLRLHGIMFRGVSRGTLFHVISNYHTLSRLLQTRRDNPHLQRYANLNINLNICNILDWEIIFDNFVIKHN